MSNPNANLFTSGLDAVLKSDLYTHAYIGDSFTQGNQDSTGYTYPGFMSTALPSCTIQNFGRNGATATEVALRSGAQPAVLASFTLPATTTAVTVTLTAPNTTDWHITESFSGNLVLPDSTVVPGVLAETSTGGSATWTFTRSNAGSSVTVLSGAVFTCNELDVYRSSFTIIQFGRNSLSFGDPAKVLPMVAAIVARLTMAQKRYLVLSVPTRYDEGTGTANYIAAQAINAQLATTYGNLYVDFREYMVQSGLTVNGLTASSADTTAMTADAPPPQLLYSDGLHPNQYGYRALALCLLNRLKQLDWIRGTLTSIPNLPAPVGTIITSDSFNRTDSVTLGSSDAALGGTSLAYTAAAQQIVSNALTGTASSGYSSLQTSSTTHRVQVVVKTTAGVSPIVGFQDTSNYYYLNTVGTNPIITRRAVSVNTGLLTLSSVTLTAGDTIEFARLATSGDLVAYKNGIEVGRVNDTTLTTGTKAGARTEAGNTTAAIDQMIIRTF